MKTYTYMTTWRPYLDRAIKYMVDEEYRFSFSVKHMKGRVIWLELKVKFASEDAAEKLWIKLNEIAGVVHAFSFGYR